MKDQNSKIKDFYNANPVEQLQLADLQSWIWNHKVLYASGKDKKMYVRMDGTFEVHHKGRKQFETKTPKLAIEVYNNVGLNKV